MTHTHDDFARLSWHDCTIWGMAFHTGDFETEDWTDDFAFDIDFIAEWLCGVDDRPTFKVAPARLVFHGVSQLNIRIRPIMNTYQVVLHNPTILDIKRELLPADSRHSGKPFYAWTITLDNHGEISFGASGFTQTLLTEPVLCEDQNLTRLERIRMLEGRKPA